MKLLILVFILLLGIGHTYGPRYVPKKCTQINFLPMPKSITCNLQNQSPYKMEDPCSIVYLIKGDKEQNDYSAFQELIEHQQYKTFKCHVSHVLIGNTLDDYQLNGFKYKVYIEVTNPQLQSFTKTSEQAYSIMIQEGKAEIKTQFYVGFVRALETLMQSVTCDKYHARNCEMVKLPIHITDEPAFTYRSVMLDTSRHYQPLHIIYETIDALMYNKMSVLHWHITDEDSFPLKLDSHPEIAQYAAYSEEQIYTSTDARDIVRYAMVRGVRVIPELDTPGHAASWGKAPQNKGVACTFGSGYMGPLDVTLDKTYTLVKEVFAQIIDIFSDPIIHLGGDEVVLTCLTNKTEFVKLQNINDREIQRHYRRKQHKIIKELNPNKIPMYWMNSKIDIEEGDIVHWWGSGLPQTTNPVVISNYGPFYLDMGVGNYFAVSYGSYSTWLDLYNQNIPKMVDNYKNKDNVLGAQITLWTEISNQYTTHLKIWIRGSSLAERTWTKQQFPAKPDFFRRITAHERLMNRRGIPTAPGTCQQCEFHPEFC